MRPLIFLHQYFFPELAGSAQQLTDLALGLRERGYPVSVITGQPSYSRNGKLPARENYKGIDIHRVPKIRLSRNTPMGRILGALSFFMMAFLNLLGMKDRRALLVIGSDPPFLGLVGWLFQTLWRRRYLLIVSDLYPDVATALGELNPRGGIMTKLLEESNRLSFQKAEKIVVLGEQMAGRVRRKLGCSSDHKIQVVHNWADGERFKPVPKSQNRFRARHGLSDKGVVFFSGNLGKIYDFGTVLEAASLMDGKFPIEFLFIGDGPCRKVLEQEIQRKTIKNIRLLPYQPEEDLPESLASGDLALIPLKREVTGLCVPGKLYYALAAGVPLLVMAPEESEASEIVRKNDCGWWISVGEGEGLARLLKEIFEDPASLQQKGKRARETFDRFFTRERAIGQYESIFASIEAGL